MSKLVSKNKAISMSRSAGAMANGILNGRIWDIFQLSLGDISYRVCQWIYKLWWVQGKLQKYINDRSGDPPCHNDVPRNFMEEWLYLIHMKRTKSNDKICGIWYTECWSASTGNAPMAAWLPDHPLIFGYLIPACSFRFLVIRLSVTVG